MSGTAYYLRADTRGAMETLLTAAGIPIMGNALYAVDHIGPIYGPFTGEPGQETQSVADSRHHTNLLSMTELTAEQLSVLPVIDAPSTPSRTWA